MSSGEATHKDPAWYMTLVWSPFRTIDDSHEDATRKSASVEVKLKRTKLLYIVGRVPAEDRPAMSFSWSRGPDTLRNPVISRQAPPQPGWLQQRFVCCY